MVKIAFIVEGYTEKLLVESKSFREKMQQHGITVCDPVINAKGNGNLLPRYMTQHIQLLRSSCTPDRIAVITDLEDSDSPAAVKDRIAHEEIDDELVFISIKAIEAWFLSDSTCMSSWLQSNHHEDAPEQTLKMPWDHLKDLSIQYLGRGPGPLKLKLAKSLIEKHNFCIERAAGHNNSPSVTLFFDTIRALQQPT